MIRRATMEDVDRLVAMQAHCYPAELHDDASVIASLDAVVWDVGGFPVSAAFGRQTTEQERRDYGALYLLYSVETMPAYRGHGYASACAQELLRPHSGSVIAYALTAGGRRVCERSGMVAFLGKTHTVSDGASAVVMASREIVP